MSIFNPSKTLLLPLFIIAFGNMSCHEKRSNDKQGGKAPNILFFISDDQSYQHTSKAGCEFVKTLHFDRIANEGTYFTNAYVTSPGCSPSRASILTGKYIWQIEEAGTHASSFPAKFKVYPEILAEAGYFVGYTGKGWSPGDWKVSGRTINPAGKVFDSKTLEPIYKGVSACDYAGNFVDFLEQRSEDQPFFFWLGSHEPHRKFEKNAYRKKAKQLSEAAVPGFLPGDSVVRGDLLDYAVEIEYMDDVLGDAIAILEEKGMLDNTIIIVTSDNGMAFPRAKANCYEYGVHVPLAIRWGRNIKQGKTIHEPVSLLDVAPTLLEAANVTAPEGMALSGKSLIPALKKGKSISADRAVFSGRERHTYARYKNYTYPQRAIRKGDFLYILNLKPDRWPAGDPTYFDKKGKLVAAYRDIDGSPTKNFILDNREDPEVSKFFEWATIKRDSAELYNVSNDPDCLNNMAGNTACQAIEKDLKKELLDYLNQTNDPRVGEGNTEIFETYPRLKGPMRKFPKEIK
jgi:N-sulfoglucosamine sulfohydrolase